MEEKLKTDFNKVVKSLNLSDENVRLRENDLNEFIKEGFPNKRKEEWKFFDLNQIITKNIKDLNFFNKCPFPSKSEKISYIENFEHNRIVFVNGYFSSIDFSHEEKNKINVEKDLNLIKKNNQTNNLIFLNNALLSNYIKITVKENYSLNRPLIIYNFTNKELDSTMINLRTDIVLEKNSLLKLVTLSNDESQKNFININQNFRLAKDAILKNYKIDSNDNANIKYFYNNIDSEHNSLSETFIFSKGSDFIKNEVNCNLNGKYSSAFINGVININKYKHHEIKTNINHLEENTKSYQLIKSVLNDNSKGIYQGKIFVNSRAQKTDGYQLRKALLLGDNSEFDAKPELEIYADDVKCSHGSTSGSLDKDSIFYLMSRGLNYKQSKELLINGFLLDVVEKITDTEIKDLVKSIMEVKA